MYVVSFFLLCLTLPLYAANILTTQIHDVDIGLPGQNVLVFLKSGDVARLSQAKLKLLEKIQSRNQSSWFKLTLDDDRWIKKVQSVKVPKHTVKNHRELIGVKSLEAAFVPTTLASYEKAKEYIRESRRTIKPETQCFNRAMVWTYEWWRKHSLKSGKVLIFWSKDYVRRNEFKWWFHISPYVHVMSPEGKVVERALDVKYTSRPYEFQEWADFHSKVDAKCMVANKYTDFANYPYGNDCYLYRTNMYTYQPADLEMNEAWGYTKSAFNMAEVKAAYLEAFEIQY
ncbi:MAG TPA: protein-glutamine glutaminase family protein [Bacteriovoracaceae bacterium]|nr:protein-glutamine glutaminase family protein [Bacteriovoracaceae bacterium]